LVATRKFGTHGVGMSGAGLDDTVGVSADGTKPMRSI
jgi:hypothetical protein